LRSTAVAKKRGRPRKQPAPVRNTEPQPSSASSSGLGIIVLSGAAEFALTLGTLIAHSPYVPQPSPP
jgi:hypothetical protein